MNVQTLINHSIYFVIASIIVAFLIWVVTKRVASKNPPLLPLQMRPRTNKLNHCCVVYLEDHESAIVRTGTKSFIISKGNVQETELAEDKPEEETYNPDDYMERN